MPQGEGTLAHRPLSYYIEVISFPTGISWKAHLSSLSDSVPLLSPPLRARASRSPRPYRLSRYPGSSSRPGPHRSSAHGHRQDGGIRHSLRRAPRRAPTGHIRALVLVPTRELALQVTAELVSLRIGSYPRMAAVYGGASMGEQLQAAQARRRRSRRHARPRPRPPRPRHPRRLEIEFLVLDEADEMLDMGFIEDIEAIMEKMRR